MFGCFRVGRLVGEWWIVLYDRCGGSGSKGLSLRCE